MITITRLGENKREERLERRLLREAEALNPQTREELPPKCRRGLSVQQFMSHKIVMLVTASL